MTTDAGSIFEITDIEGTDPYKIDVTGDKKMAPEREMRWNYCTFLDGTNNAYAIWKKGAVEYVVANEHILPGSAVNIRDANDDTKTIGVSFKQGSDTLCPGTTDNFSMKTNILCDEAITGAPTVADVTTTDMCSFVVNMKHKDGCPIVEEVYV